MNWSNIRWIFLREVRDQLRDRRTLFLIAVLPLLLYPLLGTSLFQVVQFMREHPTRVLVIGAQELPASPRLFEGSRFAEGLFSSPERSRLLEVAYSEALPNEDAAAVKVLAEKLLREDEFEAVLYFPSDFALALESFRRQLAQRGAANSPEAKEADEIVVPAPEIYFDTALEKSQLTQVRLVQVLNRWTEEVGRYNLESGNLPAAAARPFRTAEHDVASRPRRQAAMWSKLLPFMLLIWALTGAFYPAVDLCAGEKERGTLETLLVSPAERSEIVWGKLLTIMAFSMATAALNLASVSLTGSLLLKHLDGGFGPPPAMAPVWLLLALVPVSALFSALCLALAAFARSSKEGQYYLMPLVLVTMPLVMLPMAPGVELNLGNSLIPITGIVLFLRSLLEGQYLAALPFAGPVVAVTIACCLLAMRWAIDQFNTESVLFRESEKLELRVWLRHLRRDRNETPTVSEALFCGILILLLQFFLNVSLAGAGEPLDLGVTAAVTQLATIATPALLMAVMLTRDPARTLLVRGTTGRAVAAAALLAVLVHPAATWLGIAVQQLYPVSDELKGALAGMFRPDTSLVELFLAAALLPAVCEELAFRGFILSGLRHLGHKWRAIALCSILFGVAHGVVQQSIVAAAAGVLLGYVAVQTGSLWPCIAFHAVHNSLGLAAMRVAELGSPELLAGWLYESTPDGIIRYTWPVVAAAAFCAWLVAGWFKRLPYARTDEERMQEAIQRRAASESVRAARPRALAGRGD